MKPTPMTFLDCILCLCDKVILLNYKLPSCFPTLLEASATFERAFQNKVARTHFVSILYEANYSFKQTFLRLKQLVLFYPIFCKDAKDQFGCLVLQLAKTVYFVIEPKTMSGFCLYLISRMCMPLFWVLGTAHWCSTPSAHACFHGARARHKIFYAL